VRPPATQAMIRMRRLLTEIEIQSRPAKWDSQVVYFDRENLRIVSTAIRDMVIELETGLKGCVKVLKMFPGIEIFNG